MPDLLRLPNTYIYVSLVPAIGTDPVQPTPHMHSTLDPNQYQIELAIVRVNANSHREQGRLSAI